MMIQETLAFAEECLAQGRKVALVTVTETTGSSPASAGQMMAVLADGKTAGTVGGGATELHIKKRALSALNNNERVFEFSLDHAQCGMVCGGSMKGFGNILGEENNLYIFGGGHIAQCLAPLAVSIGFFVTVIEDRSEFAAEFPNVKYVLCNPSNYENEIQLSDSAYAVICTRGHQTDDEALRFCLAKSPKYLGMIGSSKKVEIVLEKLKKDGYPEEKLASIYTPIGLDIAGSVPAEIAVSIMAEILLIKNNGSPDHKRRRAKAKI